MLLTSVAESAVRKRHDARFSRDSDYTQTLKVTPPSQNTHLSTRLITAVYREIFQNSERVDRDLVGRLYNMTLHCRETQSATKIVAGAKAVVAMTDSCQAVDQCVVIRLYQVRLYNSGVQLYQARRASPAISVRPTSRYPEA